MTAVGLKVVLLGSCGVGKTSLFERFVRDSNCGDAVPAIGADFAKKMMVSSTGNKFVIGLWDTAGHERFDSMSRLFYRGASAAIVCFDLVSKASWEKAKVWARELKLKEEECKIYLCGTKFDLVKGNPEAIWAGNVIKYAGEIKATYQETSSKTGKNVDKIFQMIVDDFEKKPSGTVIENVCLTGEEVQSKCC